MKDESLTTPIHPSSFILHPSAEGSLFSLLQITDSLFPAGSFAHSGGLEGLLDGQRPSLDELRKTVAAIFERHLLRADGLLGAAAHAAARRGDLERIVEIDRELLALKLTRELREASTGAGRGFLGAVRPLIANPVLEGFCTRVEAGSSPGNYAIAFQVAAAAGGAQGRDSALAWGYQSIAQMASALMRLGLLGHRGAHEIIASLRQRVERAAGELAAASGRAPSSFAPRLEIASMRHERQYSRLFRS